MVQFAASLLRGVIATFVGLLIAGGTLTFAADRAAVQHPTLVSVAPAAPTTLDIPDVTGQAYVFAKGILQDHGFAWHVSGQVQGYAANTVTTQQPPAGTTVLDTGAPLIVLTLARNPSYIEKGSPDNDAPYPGTAIKLPATVRQRPTTTVTPRLQPVQTPYPSAPSTATPSTTPLPTTVAHPTTPVNPAASPVTTVPTPVVTTPVGTPPPSTTPITTTPVTPTPTPTPTPVPTPAPVTSPSGPRAPDFKVTGAPKEPASSLSLPDRVTALASFVETHRAPTAASLNHWLYEHAYIVAGARFGWWHGAQALQSLIDVDKRAEALWGVGSQSRITAEKALTEVRAHS